MTKLNAFCQTCGDRPCPDCFPGETFNRTVAVYSDMLRRMSRRVSTERRLHRGFLRRWSVEVHRSAQISALLRGMADRVAYWREEAKDARMDGAQITMQRDAFEAAIRAYVRKVNELFRIKQELSVRTQELLAELDQTRNELAEAAHKRDSRVESLACALYLIAERGCRYFPERTSCRDMRGKARAWCDACVAIDALGHDPSGRS